jgi:hypothetical protein
MAEKFFLGGVTPGGFYTPLNALVNSTEYYTYILKGGPGTGKSSLMEKVARENESKEKVTRFYCSSDPDSLDAVVLNSSKVIIVDGTPPHIFEPLFPGVCQKIINLGECWKEELIKEKSKEIIDAIKRNKTFLKEAGDNNKILGNVCNERMELGKKYILSDRALESANELWNQIKKPCEKEKGEENIAILSVMTRYGYKTLLETIRNYSKVYVIKDDCFAAADMWLDILSKGALNEGFDVKVSTNLLFGNRVIEHLLIDELDAAFISSNILTRIQYPDARVIDCKNFYREDFIKEEAALKENESLIDELKNLSSKLMNDAKIIHDEIESYYIRAMDFDALNKMCMDKIKI